MRTFLRRCRGALGLGVAWAAAWAGVFALVAFVISVVDPPSVDPGEGPLDVAPIGALFGLVSGVAFALVLSLADHRRTLGTLSVWRAALWGALGTAAYPLLMPVPDGLVLFVCPIGAALAAATVAVAKRSARAEAEPA